jgi:hypothetical protein
MLVILSPFDFLVILIPAIATGYTATAVAACLINIIVTYNAFHFSVHL